MKYMGSKDRHAKDILPILMQHRVSDSVWYIEPFVGGANMIDKVTGNRFGADINTSLITLWKAVSEGWMPDAVYTESEYNIIKQIKDPTNPLTAYMGFALSYGGKWFGGWCRDSQGKRDYVGEAYRNALKQFPLLSGVRFANKSYNDLHIPSNLGCIIYCDPPYKGTTKYKDDFDHDKFYSWCIEQRCAGHHIYISEYDMPSEFKCVWEKAVSSSLAKDTGSKTAVERLFIVK